MRWRPPRQTVGNSSIDLYTTRVRNPRARNGTADSCETVDRGGRFRGNVARVSGLAFIPVAVWLAVSTLLAPPASADATDDLRAAIAAKRGNCPVLQRDPVLDGVAEQANRETQDYAQQIARFKPMEDPMPTLQRLGYPASKAKLLSGFSGPERDDAIETAIKGATLFGWDTIPDCTYNRYGAHAMLNTLNGNATAAVVLAGD